MGLVATVTPAHSGMRLPSLLPSPSLLPPSGSKPYPPTPCPLPIPLQAVLGPWIKALFRVVELLPTHPATAFLAAASLSQQQQQQPGGQNGTSGAGTTLSPASRPATSDPTPAQAPSNASLASTGSTPGSSSHSPLGQGVPLQPTSVVVEIPRGADHMWLQLGLGLVGLLVVAVCVIRYGVLRMGWLRRVGLGLGLGAGPEAASIGLLTGRGGARWGMTPPPPLTHGREDA